MAISRWTRARLQIVAVVAAIGAALAIAISWLLSRMIDFPYDLPGARNGLTIGSALAALDR